MIAAQTLSALRGLVCLASLIVAASCAQKSRTADSLQGSRNAIPVAQATSAPGEVFPAVLSRIPSGCEHATDSNPPLLDDFYRDWYSAHLRAAGEGPLIDAAQRTPARFKVRLTWLRSFDHSVVLGIDTSPRGEAELSAKVLSGAGGYEPGNLATSVRRTLAAGEIAKVREAITRSRLLSQPRVACELGADGAQWIIEVVDGDSYYFLDRWSPERGPVREVAEMLMALTNMNFGEVY